MGVSIYRRSISESYCLHSSARIFAYKRSPTRVRIPTHTHAGAHLYAYVHRCVAISCRVSGFHYRCPHLLSVNNDSLSIINTREAIPV